MSLITFVKAETPCVRNEVIDWHLKHGWVWNAVYRETEIGVFYCDIFAGDGVVVHFDMVKHIKVPPAAILGGIRKGIGMVANCCSIVLATVPQSKWHLIRVLLRLGFQICTNYRRGEDQIKVLQFFGREKLYGKRKQPSTKGVKK